MCTFIGEQGSNVTQQIYIGDAKSADSNFIMGPHIALSLVKPHELGLDNSLSITVSIFYLFINIV